MKNQCELCAMLTDATGITWKIGADTCEPQASGAVLNYWLTTSKSGLHTLIATNVFGETIIDEVLSEQDIIDLVNKTEDLA